MRKEEIRMNKGEDKQSGNSDRKYIVFDIVFYANSLNYDQGGSNYQELKKITKWDGRQYILVSRYALRYSILHHAEKLFPDKWKLAGRNELSREDVVVHASRDLVKKGEILNFPEFDLFGFMIAEKGRVEEEKGALSRVSPVKISHAISLTPYNYDSHFMANLDMMKRAGGSGSNPVTIEEKKDFYTYNVVIDVNRVGIYTKEESGFDKDIKLSDNEKIQRILELVDTIFSLKREIKGRMEDLSPWLVICGLYNNGKYETFLDKIELAKSHVYKIITKTKKYTDSDGRNIEEVENEIVKNDTPKFIIDIDNYEPINNLKELKERIVSFLEDKIDNSNILIYKRKNIEIIPTK
ncbi:MULTISPECIES: type I-B CRISPR-associated protein Cas7/Cst2/DevR [Candidatus Nitrosocaldus]|jgi:CRISPR-associated protein Cst2|uniref:Putative CRISPR-associated negative autoregulator, DevR family n=1 Tax=Candidatus Nitrosocaldus cavascurensis TaxID=2058097 RepID=A0A2K5ATH1_9ARCH|nr:MULTISPECIES: type I-B CRISPR-associated protein Cas7/Cst2/DevR [Candidatus Nitrosocaldus]SPC34946.1 putative CRISPR-associated negative autoregulator, DevR family [Candidatus Nitrosocaldus cavascurensis]